MSTGKRLAKRSILGTRVCAPYKNGRYKPGVIQATKTDNVGRENLYCVLFEDKSTDEFRSKDLVGPGFQNVTCVKLCEGQKVFVTFNGREVTGRVVSHSPPIDEVFLVVDPSQNSHVTQEIHLKKKLEEIRLMESRKSARLQDQDTDYSRLADGQTEPRRRAASFSIDVPAINGSCRKRRPSADDDVMDDCMAAAMVLMSLSCSPKSPRLPEYGIFSGAESWASSSSGAHSWSSCQSLAPISSSPASPESCTDGQLDSLQGEVKRTESEDGSYSSSRDEGIDMDDDEDDEDDEDEETTAFLSGSGEGQLDPESTDTLSSKQQNASSEKCKSGCKVVFQCTWRGCSMQFEACEEVEKHVRSQHLRDSDLTDNEEEFYYTEIEMDLLEEDNLNSHLEAPLSPEGSSDRGLPREEVSFSSIYTSSAPTLSHLDMVRPPHEDPEYRRTLMECVPGEASSASPINIPHLSPSLPWQPHAYAASAPGIMVSPQKLMRLSPKTVSSSLKGSPLHRKGRSESRKCRKIYGMENRDMWCTQCKWKKACTRFQD